MGLVTRWREYARQYGFGGLVRHLAARAVRPLWETSSVLLLTLEPPAPALSAKAPIQMGVLTPEKALQAGLSRPDWTSRWQQGDTCYGAWLDGVCVHHSWVRTGDSVIGEIHALLQLAADEAYIYDCFTSANVRGLGIFPAVLSHIAREQLSGGMSRLWIAVEAANLSSLRAIQRAGFRLAGELTYRRIGGLRRTAIDQKPGTPPIRVG